jgi:hypothetical protein
MDVTSKLRDRLAKVRAVSAHELRASEHGVLERVLYKNRSQHRRGPYFRRLEHVLRALRASRDHPAWIIVDGAAPSGVAPLAFSDLTVLDLEDLQCTLAVAPTTAIPVAARSVVAELVCRGHFLPFSLTIIAVLARLYVIERKLCAQLAAAVSEMRILLAVGATGEAASCLLDDEDVGESIAKPAVPSRPLVTKEKKPAVVPEANESLTRPCRVSLPTPAIVVPESQSLYELLAPDDKVAALVVQCVVKGAADSVAGPTLASSHPFGRPLRNGQSPLPTTQSAVATSSLIDGDMKDSFQDPEDEDVDIDDIFADLDD